MINLLKELKKKVVIAYVGGSDLSKQKEQLGESAASDLFDFGFSENGVVAYRKGIPISIESLLKYLGEEKYKTLVGNYY
jgi:phosphomannomutase